MFQFRPGIAKGFFCKIPGGDGHMGVEGEGALGLKPQFTGYTFFKSIVKFNKWIVIYDSYKEYPGRKTVETLQINKEFGLVSCEAFQGFNNVFLHFLLHPEGHL